MENEEKKEVKKEHVLEVQSVIVKPGTMFKVNKSKEENKEN